jgi:transposase
MPTREVSLLNVPGSSPMTHSRPLPKWRAASSEAKTRLIYSNKRKTDEIDAENLARLARLDPKLLYPLKHRGEHSQAHLAIIRSREALVGSRTQLVNHVRGAVKSFGHRLPKCPARSFHKRAPEHIPEALRPAVEPLLETIGSLTRSASANMTGSWK